MQSAGLARERAQEAATHALALQHARVCPDPCLLGAHTSAAVRDAVRVQAEADEAKAAALHEQEAELANDMRLLENGYRQQLQARPAPSLLDCWCSECR